MNKDKVRSYFDRHPGTNEFHITSDGAFFFTSAKAESHVNGDRIKDKTIELVTRAQADAWGAEGEDKGDNGGEQKSFAEMDGKELRAVADKYKIEYKANTAKAKLIEWIVAAQEAESPDDGGVDENQDV